MSRALICGGGGSVGTAWESGWFAGLQQQGVWLNDADFILGTSAGAGVGVQVACGHDMMAQVERYRAAGKRAAAGGTTAVLNIDTEGQSAFRGLFERGQASGRNGDVAVRKEIAEAARAAVPIIELEPFLRTFILGVGAGALLEGSHVALQVGAGRGGGERAGRRAGCRERKCRPCLFSSSSLPPPSLP